MAGKGGKDGEAPDRVVRIVPGAGRPGRKPHEVTKERQTIVRLGMASGFTQKQVAALIEIEETTLRKYYARELEVGALEVNLAISTNLANIARSPTHPKATSAAIFWAKTRMGWKEARFDDPEAPGDDAPVEFTLRLGDRG